MQAILLIRNVHFPSWFSLISIVVYAHVMGVDYVVIGFDMEIQPLVTHNAAWPLCSAHTYDLSAIRIDVVCSHKLLAQMPWVLLA